MFLLDAINARPAQPQGAFSVAPDLASGLLALFNAPNPSPDWTRIGTITQQPIAAGVAFESGAVGTRYEKTVAGNQNTGFTMFLRFVVRVTTVQDYCGIYNGATYESLIYVTGATRLFFLPKNGISFQAHSKVLAVGDVVTICATGNGSRYFVSTTINGVTERASGTYTGSAAYTSVHIGAKFTGTGSHRTMTGAFWTRALPDELVDLLARGPLRLFDDETHSTPVAFTASGGTNGTASGVTITATTSIIAGSASGVRSPTVSGVTMTATASLIAGAASAAGNATAPGATMTVTTSIIAGAASAVRNETALGALIVATVSMIAGAASAFVPGTGGAWLPTIFRRRRR